MYTAGHRTRQEDSRFLSTPVGTLHSLPAQTGEDAEENFQPVLLAQLKLSWPHIRQI